jgi:hypothetical protein
VTTTRARRGLPLRLVGAALALAPAACATFGLHEPGTDDAPEVLVVSLDDVSIAVTPRQAARGRIGLEIVNRGMLEHAVRIVGPGVDEQATEFLGPTQHRRQWLRLGPGTYRLFCPDGDHAERGMWTQLIVTETPSWFRR